MDLRRSRRPAPAPRTARDRVALGIVVALASMVAFVAYSYRTTETAIDTTDRIADVDITLFSHAWEIRFLDSELTIAATRYIDASPEDRVGWLDRYNAAATRLDEVLAATSEQAPAAELQHLTAVDDANIALVALETEIIRLADAGEVDQARALLDNEYTRQKAIYGGGIDRYFDAQQIRIDNSTATVAAQARSTRVAILAVLVVVALILGYLGWANHEQRSETRSRERERDLLNDDQRRQARIQTALDMANTEVDSLETLRITIEQELDGWDTEILLADSSTAHLHREITTNVHGEPSCGVTTPADCPALRRGSTLVFDDAGRYDACPHLRGRDFSCHSAVCTPIKIMGKPVGVAHSVTPTTRSDDEVPRIDEIIRLFGDRLGVLRAFATTKRQASRDPLTGLLNRRSLEDEASKLDIADSSYAVAFCDIDRFKTLNDTHGHAVGDRALRHFSQVLTDSLRPTDIVARWGGEEFVVIMPESPEDAAAAAMDRAREALAISLIGASLPRFTFSAGVCDATNLGFEHATSRADHRLLQAKRDGRDHVVASGAAADRTSTNVNDH